MTSLSPRLARDLTALTCAYRLTLSHDARRLFVHGVTLPPGHNLSQMVVFIEIPSDYPLSPPGVGKSHIYVPSHLRFQGRHLRDVHEDSVLGPMGWAWFCYRSIRWDPCQDDLIRLMELNRLFLTDPPTI
jgi:hypothetical protein